MAIALNYSLCELMSSLDPPPPPPPAPRHTIDLGVIAAHGALTVKPPETREERLARLAEAAEESKYRRRKDWWTFVVTLLVSLSIGVASFVLAVRATGDLQKWSMSLVTLLLGGAVGFWTGTKSASKP